MLNVRDRGSKKWVSLMLPEHVELLQEAILEKEDKPILDEQKMLEIDYTLKSALIEQLPIELIYFRHGKYKKVVSRLEKIDQWRGLIVLKSEEGSRISLSDIVDAKLK